MVITQRKKIRNKLAKYLHNKYEDIDDVLQNAYLGVLERVEKGVKIKNFDAYLNQTIKYKTFDLVYDYTSKFNKQVPIGRVDISTNPNFHTYMETDLVLNNLYAFSDTLTPAQEIIFKLYLEDCTYEEISELIGSPYNTVKANMRFALLKLKEADIL